jgi:diaminohydroxyphosphoribosylaminopyrimidine deaminase/5-amino-6-(5-phosphoribosylamino)uracil reductase
VRRVVAAATDPNPKHAGRGFDLLRAAGLEVVHGVLAAESNRMNEPFNHWIVHRTPWVTVKAAMTLDGKIATASGESKWITGERARGHVMKLRQGTDAILVGVNTVLSDNPQLTLRTRSPRSLAKAARLRRVILDSEARTPLDAHVVRDDRAALTTVVVSEKAQRSRVRRLSEAVTVWTAPLRDSKLDLPWVLRRLGEEDVGSLLVEGGGEVHASFLLQRLAHRVAFYYAPKILGGRTARRAVAGEGVADLSHALRLTDLQWRDLGDDLLVTARCSACSDS